MSWLDSQARAGDRYPLDKYLPTLWCGTTMTGRRVIATMLGMTDFVVDRTSGGCSPLVDAAVAAADAAASAAGVQVRQLAELAELSAVQRLYEAIWRLEPRHPPMMTAELLRAMVKAGSYVAGAFADGDLVGACVGFFSAPADVTLHSHITGVSAGMRHRSIGFALKTHQRAWALLRGVSTVSWTFDPLVRRNAYFNLGKLAAIPAEYLPHFYGEMHDGINSGDDTDRLSVTWHLEDAAVAAACRGAGRDVAAAEARSRGASVGLDVSGDGRPVLGALDGETVLVAVPVDIEQLRTESPPKGQEWRRAMREVLGVLMSDGARVTGFDREGWYVVTKNDERTGVDPALSGKQAR